MFAVTHKAAHFSKWDCLTDYERRELDCWIAANIDQYCVRHEIQGIQPGSAIRLSDLAYREFQKTHPKWVSTASAGPYKVPAYSFSPAVALNTFQDTEYADGWEFTRKNERWFGFKGGLSPPPCRSLALCMMLALKREYLFQNHKEETHVTA